MTTTTQDDRTIEPTASLQAWTESVLLPPHPSVVRRAREFVAEQSRAAALPGHLRETAVLLASEVVTNAVLHARGSALLTVVTEPDRVVVEVEDGDSRLPRPVPARHDAPDGRGLTIVAALATRWGVRESVGGKVVWFEVAAGDSPEVPGEPATSDAPLQQRP